MGWRNRPKFIDYCPPNIDYVFFIDENGTGEINYIQKNINKFKQSKEILTITGVAIKAKDLNYIKQQILNLKIKYWPPYGYYSYKNQPKRVCFHSREIRHQEGPFSQKIINYNAFIQDLSNTISNLPIQIFSSSIDKVAHVKKYVTPIHPYNLSLNFIIERFVKYFLHNNQKAIIVIEAQGKKEDNFKLKYLKDFVDNGSDYVTREDLSKIKGIYFNEKWSKKANCLKSYFGLEIADLCSYPIHKYIKYGVKDPAYKCIENKIYGYPSYMGKGLKIFP